MPNIYRGFGEHALQNAYNSFYHGAVYWGDYDMFWTGHHDALPHMTLRAVSGGPVYFSDAPGKTNAAMIRPLVYSDGRIIRCSQPGRPTKDWLTKDPQRTRAPLKMWNTAGAAGIVAAFHAYEDEDVLEGEIGPADIPGLAGERFLAYDSFRHTVRRMGAEERLRIRVAPLEAELYVIVPETGAFTAIGLTDKLVAADAVLEARFAEDRATVLLKDGGIFSFVSARRPARAVVNGSETPIETADAAQGLYRLDCPAGVMPTTVELSF
ncbi:Sip1-related alpha-galactosidase [Paenibacillus cymbidii]|uniref:Sip1-related alpha-galactosidase n=1 Tax=Paenibacillus cymbidii TaxID=1639034 RepID=UPI001A9C1F07|nr:Sip1-related alpha-galactosidase [Paenibacillus cymbidii]